MPKSDAVRTLELIVATTTEAVSIKTQPHFYRDEVMVALLRKPTIQALLHGLNRVANELIHLWLEAQVGRALQQAKDRYGVRLYENYPTRGAADDGFGAQRRWLRTGSQTAATFRILRQQPEREARQLVAKRDVYIEIAERLEAASRVARRDVRWDEIRDQVGPELVALRREVMKVALP